MPWIKVEEKVRLFVQDWGEGPPIVFLHGWPFSHRIFEYQMRALAEVHRVIGIDLRGYGESDKPLEGNDYDTWARDVVEVVIALDLRDVMLVGFCMGGAIAARCVATHREAPITKLAIVAAPLPAAAPDLPSRKRFQNFIHENLGDHAKAAHDYLVGAFHTPVSVQYLRWLEEIATRATLHARVRGLEELLIHDLSDDMARIGLPTRIFHGVHDQMIPFAAAERQQRMLRGAELVPFVKSNHAIFWDEKEKLTQELAGFAFEKIAKVA